MLNNWCSIYGAENTINAVVIGPVTPVWDKGEFCSTLTDYWAASGYKVHVIDSIKFIQEKTETKNPDSIIEAISLELTKYVTNISVIAGYALGGTLAMKLTKYLPSVTHVLNLSGPGYIDAVLKKQLDSLIAKLKLNDLNGSLALLSALVVPRGENPNKNHCDSVSMDAGVKSACRRMIDGFEFLLKLDARHDVGCYRGKLLSVLGALSQLATIENQVTCIDAERDFHQLILVPNAGMRILKDNPEFALSRIGGWLSNEK